MKLTHSYQTLPNELFSTVSLQKFNDSQIILLNQALIKQLHIAELITNNTSDDINSNHKIQEQLAQWFGGHQPLENSKPVTQKPIAQAYAGHQFGYLNILGDGRAVLLGELLSDTGELTDLQLKGSGQTPYSRGGDGKASLAPMLREYLISEAMHALNIPTTRSLAVLTTGEMVYRPRTGSAGRDTGAILARTASSHIRVGTFVYASLMQQKTSPTSNASKSSQQNQNNVADTSILSALLDYTVNRHYPQFNELPTSKKAIALLETVMDKQAELVAHWQRVGFIHGVMNTDNVTISGETIDYGPCAFMDGYDEQAVFSSIDRQARYRFGNQMPIMWWNMARFSESLLPIITSDFDNEQQAVAYVTSVIDSFGERYQQHWGNMLCAKIGLPTNEDNFAFANELLALMQQHGLDYTNTFKDLTLLAMSELDTNISNTSKLSNTPNIANTPNICNSPKTSNHKLPEVLAEWIQQWQQKRQPMDSPEKTKSLQKMQTSNPVIIPRNQLVEQALAEAENAFSEKNRMDKTADTTANLASFNKLLAVVQQPYQWDDEYITTTKSYQQPASSEWNAEYQTFCGT